MGDLNLSKKNIFNPYEYDYLIKQFKDAGYKFKKFEKNISPSKTLILRHDIDFDIKRAYQIAQLEYDLNIQSTFFFLLRSKSYNLFENDNLGIINNIQKMGHEVSLHFDPSIYLDYKSGLISEVQIFNNLLKKDLNIISLHRPNKFFLSGKSFNENISHSYEKKFFSDIEYISDSGGSFKYGHPLNSAAFKEKRSIQLLLHPIWWTTNEENSIEKLKKYLSNSNKELSNHISNNCLTWKNYLKEIN